MTTTSSSTSRQLPHCKKDLSLKRKLSKDVTLYSRYKEVMEDYLKRGMAEDGPREHASPQGSQTVSQILLNSSCCIEGG